MRLLYQGKTRRPLVRAGTTKGSALVRIGVFGGTFDPVHNGHLVIAKEMAKALGLERVLFVLAARPPHKSGQAVTDDWHRLTMLQLALAGVQSFEVSEIELHRPGKSYTADTLEQLSIDLAPASLVFLMGEDSLRDFPNWHDPKRIVKFAELGVAARPGIDLDVASIQHRIPEAAGRIHLVETSELDVSSQGIRERVALGKPIEDLVPPHVADYIHAHDLYDSPPTLA
jgi:nicotinate-nucleotide adenylyltransferase